MALQKVGSGALVAVQETRKELVEPRKIKKNVLDEEEYTEALEEIIERDFFPDLKQMSAQAEYLDAVQKNDTQKLREIHAKYGPKRRGTDAPSIYSTPATFETPDIHREQPSSKLEGEKNDMEKDLDRNPEKPKGGQLTNKSLDSFLAKNTSEDNASFGDIMAETQKNHKLKHAWLYEQEDLHRDEQNKILALPSMEQQAIQENTNNVLTWNYEVKNNVMYIPEGCEYNQKEKIEEAKKPRAIVHKNTRFSVNPFDVEKSKQNIKEAASIQAMGKLGKIGPDGKEILPEESPRVQGYGFVATPSPAPGVDDSPLMTWGEIEGTPFRLDGGDTPYNRTPGPSFKMPEVPKRDQIALDLAEKASKQHRAKKQDAIKRVTASLSTPSPKFGSTDRLNFLSPAAQRLASSKLGIRTTTDKRLRASYTPSPLRSTPSNKTPGVTPVGRKRSLATPTSLTPKSATPKNDISSLTDNLLNFSKRPRATDFF